MMTDLSEKREADRLKYEAMAKKERREFLVDCLRDAEAAVREFEETWVRTLAFRESNETQLPYNLIIKV